MKGEFIAYESLAPLGQRVVRETNENGDTTGIVLKRVRLLGLESRNGRVYNLPDPKLYEGVKINLDHPDKKTAKSVNDKGGFVRPGTVEAVAGRGIYGDVVLNPYHPRTAQHVWDAENDPANQGFSHVAVTKMAENSGGSDGKVRLDVVQVISVDLVGSPATTNGMFEQENDVNEQELRDEIARLKQEMTQLANEKAVAEQNLQNEKTAHEETKAAHEQEKREASRMALLEGLDVVPAFKKAVLTAESDEDAKALIDALDKPGTKRKATAREQVETNPTAKTEKTLEEILGKVAK